MAARGDLHLADAAIDEIVTSDLRSLRVNGRRPKGHIGDRGGQTL